MGINLAFFQTAKISCYTVHNVFEVVYALLMEIQHLQFLVQSVTSNLLVLNHLFSLTNLFRGGHRILHYLIPSLFQGQINLIGSEQGEKSRIRRWEGKREIDKSKGIESENKREESMRENEERIR